jgi:hypothetical protein
MQDLTSRVKDQLGAGQNPDLKRLSELLSRVSASHRFCSCPGINHLDDICCYSVDYCFGKFAFHYLVTEMDAADSNWPETLIATSLTMSRDGRADLLFKRSRDQCSGWIRQQPVRFDLLKEFCEELEVSLDACLDALNAANNCDCQTRVEISCSKPFPSVS